jgi:RNA polymerase sigma-70 factor, ECF subfamily
MTSSSRDEAFRTQLEPHRRAISAHCYRMLGSLEDAEEIAQDSLLRAWQRLDELRENAAAKAWLYRIATNACLDRLKQRRRRRVQPHLAVPVADPERPIGPPDHERLWIEPAPDALFDLPDDAGKRPDAQASMHENVSLAFITALQLLPPKQRAALLLVDVLGWRPRETAELLKTTEVSVNSLLQRARKNLDAASIEPQPLPGPRDVEAVRRYVAIWESGNLDAFTAMLAQDAVVSMPPQVAWYTGHAAIRRFFERALATPRRLRFVSLRANGAPAVAVYTRSVEDGAYRAAGITVLCMRGGLIAQVTRFVMPHLFPRFGLPERLPDEGMATSA